MIFLGASEVESDDSILVSGSGILSALNLLAGARLPR
jgi:hypothetical protein